MAVLRLPPTRSSKKGTTVPDADPLIHAPDREDLLSAAPLCMIEDPLAERSYTLTDVSCRACLAIIDAQPGVLSWMLNRDGTNEH
jgi:hypothetical protein